MGSEMNPWEREKDHDYEDEDWWFWHSIEDDEDVIAYWSANTDPE